ncbi:MAG: phosphate-starvation-inducible PsiE family protein [Gammaproteobacteria bacterium]|nr:phosphate-starvation-inducible PsiE family protein [Gammaproteobacteria bacterium]MDH5727660.1 phosphate-starvation-inducible PsiE family protein [Gammaproteobacteria bacterium]
MSNQNTPSPEYHKIILNSLETFGLFAIAFATVLAASSDVAIMVEKGRVTLADLLLMFIYLEVLAMVGHYFESGQLPVRFPLYIAIVALARYLILDIKAMDEWRILAVSGAILFIAFSVLVIRFGHVRFPYKEVLFRKRLLQERARKAHEQEGKDSK